MREGRQVFFLISNLDPSKEGKLTLKGGKWSRVYVFLNKILKRRKVDFKRCKMNDSMLPLFQEQLCYIRV